MIGLFLIGAVFLALLELNKNSVWGWILALAAMAAFLFVRRLALADKAWYVRGLGWIGLIAVLTAILLFTQGPFLLRPAVEGKNPALFFCEHTAVKGGKERQIYFSVQFRPLHTDSSGE